MTTRFRLVLCNTAFLVSGCWCMELQEKNKNLLSNHVKLNPELSVVVMVAMLVDKRITVSFRWELNYLFIYFFMQILRKKIVVFVNIAASLKTTNLSSIQSGYKPVAFIFNVLICTDVHVCVECVENQGLLKIIDP